MRDEYLWQEISDKLTEKHDKRVERLRDTLDDKILALEQELEDKIQEKYDEIIEDARYG